MNPPCPHCHSRGRHNAGCPVVKRVPPCRHCRVRRGWKARGLCSTCFIDRGIRDLQPPRRLCLGQADAHEDFYGPGGVPEPTMARPGSEEKTLVLQQRAARGEQLFVRGDVVLDLR